MCQTELWILYRESIDSVAMLSHKTSVLPTFSPRSGRLTYLAKQNQTLSSPVSCVNINDAMNVPIFMVACTIRDLLIFKTIYIFLKKALSTPIYLTATIHILDMIYLL